MPWEDNSGGRKSRSGGPWGQAPGGGGGGGPRRPSGPGGNTPSLEDILARGRQQFGGNVPGGGKWIILGGVAAVAIFWASQAIYTVNPQEIGVELLFGKPKEEFSLPGLHFHWWPLERVEFASTTENQTRVGSTGNRNEGLMLSGDQNIVNMSFSILWRISDPRQYLFNVRDPDEMVLRASESAMREVVGRRTAQDVFRDDRAGIAIEVQQITQQILDNYGVGVTISSISIENVAPPAEVADAFDEVQRALQDEDRFQEEARQYANTLLGSARGQAAAIREEAAAYQDRIVNEAQGQAARFVAVYNEYRNAPEVTRQRLFLETMEEVLGGTNKIVIEGGAADSGVVPYLPLTELRSTGTNSTGGNQ